MTTAYSSLLGLALPVTGELAGTWGDTVNSYITNYLDSAVAGTQTISGTQTAVTLSVTNGSALTQAGAAGTTGSAQFQIINCTGNPAGTLTITVPASSRQYIVINATSTSQSVKIVGVGPTTGVTLVAGEKAHVAWNGSDFTKVSTFGGSPSFTNVTVTGTTTLSGLTASTALALDASKNVVSVTNTGTGNNVLSASPTLTGTIGGASMTLSSLTSGRVTYAGASGLLQDSANLTFNGTTLVAATGAQFATTSGNVTVGTTNAGTAGLSISQSLNLSWEQSATESIANLFRQTSSAALVMSMGYKRSANANAFASSYGSSLAKTAISLGTTAGAITFYTDTAATTAVGTDVTPTERMRIDSSGNVGIGTASPSNLLTVSGPSIVGRFNSTNNTNVVAMAYAGTVGGYLGANGLNLIFGNSSGAEAMRIDSSGNVGIGTASPSKPLQVASTGNVEALFSTTGNAYSYLTLNTWALDRAQIRAEALNPGAGSGTGSGGLSFWTARNPTMTEAMRIDGSGNVGISTTNPGYKLEVIGPSSVTSFTGSTKLGVLVRGAAASNDYSGIDLSTNGSGTPQARIGAYFGGGGSYLQFGTSNNYGTGITNTALSIDPNGYLTALGVYNATVGATNRDVYVDNTGLIGYVSSIRASKTNIQDVTDTSWLLQLNPVSFQYRKKEDGVYTEEADGPVTFGLIAEDTEAVKPELCFYDEVDGQQELRGINYSQLVTPLLKLVQQQQEAIAKLEARVAQLEKGV